MGSATSAALSTAIVLVAVGCSHGWDDYDPRIGDAVGSGGGASGSVGGAASTGATGASSTQSSASGPSSSSGAAGGTGPGGAGSGGAPGGSGGGGVTFDCAANGTSTLTDDFDDGAVGAEWNQYGNVDEDGGTLVLDPGGSASASTFAILQSVDTYDLRNCSVTVRAAQVPSDVPNAYAGLAVYVDDKNYTELILGGPDLHSVTWVAGVSVGVLSVPYDATAHAWWRLREQGGTIFYEVSQDGIGFVEHSSVASPYSSADLGAVRPALTSGTDGASSTSVDPTLYDDFNVPP
jgi:hypothetical protein